MNSTKRTSVPVLLYINTHYTLWHYTQKLKLKLNSDTMNKENGTYKKLQIRLNLWWDDSEIWHTSELVILACCGPINMINNNYIYNPLYRHWLFHQFVGNTPRSCLFWPMGSMSILIQCIIYHWQLLYITDWLLNGMSDHFTLTTWLSVQSGSDLVMVIVFRLTLNIDWPILTEY